MNFKILSTARLIAAFIAHDPFKETLASGELREALLALTYLIPRLAVPIDPEPDLRDMPATADDLVPCDAICTEGGYIIALMQSRAHLPTPAAMPPAGVALLDDLTDRLDGLGYFDPWLDAAGAFDFGPCLDLTLAPLSLVPAIRAGRKGDLHHPRAFVM